MHTIPGLLYWMNARYARIQLGVYDKDEANNLMDIVGPCDPCQLVGCGKRKLESATTTLD